MKDVEFIQYKSVKVYPRIESYQEFRSRKENEYRREYNDPSNVFDYGSEEEFVSATLKQCANLFFYWYNQKEWFARFECGRIVKIKKQGWNECTADFEKRLDKVISKVERESSTEYGKFASMMQKLINAKLPGLYLCYPTTYGIGLLTYNFHFDKDKEAISSVLDSLGVEYYNEYSDAHYAYRFKISKKEANRALLARQ